jgi:hypothetical protein
MASDEVEVTIWTDDNVEATVTTDEEGAREYENLPFTKPNVRRVNAKPKPS